MKICLLRASFQASLLTSLLTSLCFTLGLPRALSAYPLDDISRETPAKGKVICPKLKLNTYTGKHLKYHQRLLIHPAFQASLEPFERLVNEVAVEVYGRAPKQVFHLGTFNCRRIGGYPNLISEHGLGNALDVAGFDFAPLKRDAEAPNKLPRAFKRGFKVRMLEHWTPKNKSEVAKLHSRFFQTLAKRMIDQ